MAAAGGPGRRLVARASGATPILPLERESFERWLRAAPARQRRWARGQGFEAAPGTSLALPGPDGGVERVLAGIAWSDRAGWLWGFAGLAESLHDGAYRLEGNAGAAHAGAAALGWALGCYRFDRYREPRAGSARLVCPQGVDRRAVLSAAGATWWVRDLINTPAGDLGPAELAAAARALGRRNGARVTTVTGGALLRAGFPSVHAVGRAASRSPRLVDLRWGRRGPRVTLVGKGVCFDSGGLDLKSAAGMKLMKKDMGGAAHVLGLARMVLEARLPVRLRVLIPAVENAVSGDALRPLDVIRTRKGLTVEVGNTDAEGRLILCDALAAAGGADLLVDFATLTGAARVALGPELPALFSNDDGLADALLACGRREADPLWRMPLHPPYARMLRSSVADLNNVADSPFAGAVVAALFLERFVEAGTPWLHLDVMGWNPASQPGRPEGGEAMGMRAVYALIAELAAEGGLKRLRRPAR